MFHRSIFAFVLAGSLLAAGALKAQEAGAGKEEPTAPREFVTQHAVDVGGKTLRYSAIAGEIVLHDAAGEPEASVFSISYHLDGVDDPATRPLTFLFNGGPGSTAVWLHLGAFGPRRLDLGSDPLATGAPPYPLRPNPHTLLDVTDLVFVDPIGTGYSRALGQHKNEDYWGVDEDAESMARFIRAYLSRHGRWSSPKYVGGESYGTLRAALLVRELALDVLDGVALNGAILLSAALDVRIFLSGAPGNDLAYVTGLPTYAATAYYHDRLPERPADFEAWLSEVREFAATDYLTALFQGDALPEERAAAIAARLHRYTGLDEGYLRRSRLRVPVERFVKELLRERGETIAVHDTRFRGRDPDDVGEAVTWDPFILGIAGPFVTAINAYLSDQLEVTADRRYEIFAERAGGSWKRGRGDQHVFAGYLYTVPYLAAAAATNKDFKVFVASGYHDLTTTFFGVEHTFDHSGIDKDRIVLRNYEGGHMMYLMESSLAELAADVRAFIAGP